MSTHAGPFAIMVMPVSVCFGRLLHAISTLVNNRSPSRDQSLVCVPVQPESATGCPVLSASTVCSSTFLPSVNVVITTPVDPFVDPFVDKFDGCTHTVIFGVAAVVAADRIRSSMPWLRTFSTTRFQHP